MMQAAVEGWIADNTPCVASDNNQLSMSDTADIVLAAFAYYVDKETEDNGVDDAVAGGAVFAMDVLHKAAALPPHEFDAKAIVAAFISLT
jgi:hypothetical protein